MGTGYSANKVSIDSRHWLSYSFYLSSFEVIYLLPYNVDLVLFLRCSGWNNVEMMQSNIKTTLCVWIKKNQIK